ncbi:hypothetical protein [Streptomyces sp. NPDC057909]|uniref:hypothetical protein n=1 Tax=Streptomyces sp. NPDC057909 TaxID=3346277 RepID=UPI0036E5D1ED
MFWLLAFAVPSPLLDGLLAGVVQLLRQRGLVRSEPGAAPADPAPGTSSGQAGF